MTVSEYLLMTVGIFVLGTFVLSVVLMLLSYFTPKTAFFSNNKTKAKGFLTWLYVLLFDVLFFFGFGVGEAAASGQSVNHIFLAFRIFAGCLFVSAVLAIVFRPLVLWYWKIDERLETKAMITKQNEAIIEILKAIAANSEQQTTFFDRVLKRSNGK